MKTYTIIKELLPMVQEKIDKFARRYNVYYTFKMSEPYLCEDTTSNRFGCTLVDITVDAEYKIKGYKFIAACEWVEETKSNIIKKLSNDFDVPEYFRTRNFCDHCKTNHTRKYTVILLNIETGEYVQVGKGCLKEFNGVSVTDYTAFISFFDTIDEYQHSVEVKNSIRIKHEYKVSYILELACSLAEKYGYVSRKVSDETGKFTTAAEVYQLLNKREYDPSIGITRMVKTEISDSAKEKAQAVIHYFKDGVCEDNSDWVENLKILMQLETVSEDKVGMVVSALGTYERLINTDKEKVNKPKSEFIGKVGEKVTFSATPTVVYSDETEYGWVYIYKMIVNDKDVVIWKTSKDLDTEKELQFTATVKALDEYHGEKQTVITRAKTQVIFA